MALLDEIEYVIVPLTRSATANIVCVVLEYSVGGGTGFHMVNSGQ